MISGPINALFAPDCNNSFKTDKSHFYNAARINTDSPTINSVN